MPGGKKKSEKKRRQKAAINPATEQQEDDANNPTNNNNDQSMAKVFFSIEDIPGKGEGLVASVNLVPGTIIITEKPLIAVDSAFADIKVFPEFRALSADKKTAVMSLYDPGEELNSKHQLLSQDEIEKKALRIFEANCIALCGHKEMNIKKSGLYQTISKINHSCSPNVNWSWIKEDPSKCIKQVLIILSVFKSECTFLLKVRVIRDIKVGEEILASYLDKSEYFPTRDERIQTLHKIWFFTCTCQEFISSNTMIL